jgi:hypothetical protein
MRHIKLFTQDLGPPRDCGALEGRETEQISCFSRVKITRVLGSTAPLATLSSDIHRVRMRIVAANLMSKLDSSQRYSRTPKSFKAARGGASTFDRSMILLNQIIEV